MMKNLFLIGALFVSSHLWAEEAKITVRDIEESRSEKLVKEKSNFTSFNNDSLTVKIDFLKVGLAAASKYKFEIKSAKDSSGKELKQKGFKVDDFKKIDRKFMFFSSQDKERDPNLLRLDLQLDKSSRSAETVDIEGFLVVQGGDQNAVFFKNLKSIENQELKNTNFTKAGIKITFEKVNKGNVKFKITAGKDAISEIKLVDVNGKSLSNGSSSGGFGGVTSYTLYTNGEIGDDAMLKFMVISNLKEMKVPFKLNKLQLP